MDRKIELALDMLCSGEITFDEAMEAIARIKPQTAVPTQNTPKRAGLAKKVKIKIRYFDEESGKQKTIRLPGIGLRSSKYIVKVLLFIAGKVMLRCADGETRGKLGGRMGAIKRSQTAKREGDSGKVPEPEVGNLCGEHDLCEFGSTDVAGEDTDECVTKNDNREHTWVLFKGMYIRGMRKEIVRVVTECIEQLRRCEPVQLVCLESDDANIEIYTY